MNYWFVVQLAASASTIASTYFYGNKTLWGPRIGLLSQLFWWSIMFKFELWGLLPINVASIIIHARNYKKWK